MNDPITPAELRALMAAADDLPDRSAATWNARRDAEQSLRQWRTWLPGLLDLIEARAIEPESPTAWSAV